MEGSLWAWLLGMYLGPLKGGKTRLREGHIGRLQSFYGTLETQPQGERLLQGWPWGFQKSPKAKRYLHPACQPQAQGAKLSQESTLPSTASEASPPASL